MAEGAKPLQSANSLWGHHTRLLPGYRIENSISASKGIYQVPKLQSLSGLRLIWIRGSIAIWIRLISLSLSLLFSLPPPLDFLSCVWEPFSVASLDREQKWLRQTQIASVQQDRARSSLSRLLQRGPGVSIACLWCVPCPSLHQPSQRWELMVV